MIVSVHIPKCGGISFEHVLRGIYGDKGVLRHYRSVTAEAGDGALRAGKKIRCIHGHFAADAWEGPFPGADLVTWLRHPVERVISNYHHFFRHPDPGNPVCRELLDRNLSLAQFAELAPMRNEATRYLAGKPLDAFSFVGVTERYQESLQVFGRLFGARVPRRVPRENANPDRLTDTYPVARSLYDRILALNLSDFAVYHEAADRLDQALSASGFKAA